MKITIKEAPLWHFVLNCMAYVPIACDYAIQTGNFSFRTGICAVCVLCLLIFGMTYNIKTLLRYYSGGTSIYNLVKDNLGAYPAVFTAAASIADCVLTGVIMSLYFAYFTERIFTSGDFRYTVPISCLAVIFVGAVLSVKKRLHSFVSEIMAIVFAVFVVGAFVFLAFRVHLFDYGRLFLGKTDDFSVIKVIIALSMGAIGFNPLRYIDRSGSRNRAKGVLRCALSVISIVFIITLLASYFGLAQSDGLCADKIISGVFHNKIIIRIFLVFMSLFMLVCAYNSFSALSLISEEMAKDKYFPTLFRNNKDDVMFAVGNGLSALLILIGIFISGGRLFALIPVYMISVFSASVIGLYALSKKTDTFRRRIMSLFGCAVSLVLICFSLYVGKNAWVIFPIILGIGLFMLFVSDYYEKTDQSLVLGKDYYDVPSVRHTSVVIITDLDKGIVPAVQYAMALSEDCRAVYVASDDRDEDFLADNWEYYFSDVPLVVLKNKENNNVIKPVLKYISMCLKKNVGGFITVVIPEYIPCTP
ncbi:MAG: APC family permease, partial [Armatimonadetes bacterium]|nr:APC family permease [Candidatus Hippobium faecium]